MDPLDVPDLSGDVEILEHEPRFSGNYSRVYLGRLKSERTLVAIKIPVPIQDIPTHTMRRKVEREKRTWNALKHPNILPMLGFVEDIPHSQQFGAFISPWRHNGDLTKYLGSFDLPIHTGKRINLWKDVVAGVAYLHTHSPKLIHGDLKPKNVLISGQGRAQICDFGLVSIHLKEGKSGLTTTSAHTGTARYLAYELVLLESDAPTTASDIYATGCIGLEAIFQEAPYPQCPNGYNLVLEIHRYMQQSYPPAMSCPKPSPDTAIAWDMVSSCWKRNPSERPTADFLDHQLTVLSGASKPQIDKTPRLLLPSSDMGVQNGRHVASEAVLSGIADHPIAKPPSRSLISSDLGAQNTRYAASKAVGWKPRLPLDPVAVCAPLPNTRNAIPKPLGSGAVFSSRIRTQSNPSSKQSLGTNIYLSHGYKYVQHQSNVVSASTPQQMPRAVRIPFPPISAEVSSPAPSSSTHRDLDAQNRLQFVPPAFSLARPTQSLKFSSPGAPASRSPGNQTRKNNINGSIPVSNLDFRHGSSRVHGLTAQMSPEERPFPAYITSQALYLPKFSFTSPSESNKRNAIHGQQPPLPPAFIPTTRMSSVSHQIENKELHCEETVLISGSSRNPDSLMESAPTSLIYRTRSKSLGPTNTKLKWFQSSAKLEFLSPTTESTQKAFDDGPQSTHINSACPSFMTPHLHQSVVTRSEVENVQVSSTTPHSSIPSAVSSKPISKLKLRKAPLPKSAGGPIVHSRASGDHPTMRRSTKNSFSAFLMWPFNKFRP